MTAILAATLATLFLASALVAWRRPIAFWASIAGLASCTLWVLIVAGQMRVADFVVVWAFALLGPTAAVLSLLRLRVLTRNFFLTIVAAVVAFVSAAALWVIVAVNVGALEP